METSSDPNVDPWKCHSAKGTQDGPTTTMRDWDSGWITYHNTFQTGKRKPRIQIFKVNRISTAVDLGDKLTKNLLNAAIISRHISQLTMKRISTAFEFFLILTILIP